MERALVIFPIVALLIFGATFIFRRYTGLSKESAWLATFGSMAAAGVQMYRQIEASQRLLRGPAEAETILRIMASGVFIVFVAVFVFRIWGRWIGGKANSEEQQPGVPGVRAWFSGGNVFVGAVIIVSGWWGQDIPMLFSALLVVAALAAQPILTIDSPASTPATAPEDLSAEREKIVSMLEAGKLTAEESAELLQALGESSRAASKSPVPLTGPQRLMLIGAALVALGFFLPWLVINPGNEANRLIQQVRTSTSFPMPADFPLEEMRVKTASMTFTGGDIQKGLGWATLILALFAAAIPYLATTLDAATTRTVRFLCLAVGALIVLYLTTQNLRFVGVGLVIAVGGYVLEIVGAMRERNVVS